MRSFEVTLVTMCSLGCLAWAQDAAQRAWQLVPSLAFVLM